MLKYRGQYRVIFECDKNTGKPLENTFIPCRVRKGVNICRYNETTLNVYIPGIKAVKTLLGKHPDIFTLFQMGDHEATLLFPESKMQQAAAILKPIIKGANISPKSKAKNSRFI